MSQFPDTGKIQDEFFKSFIYPYCGARREEVKTAPQYGVDVSVIALPNNLEMALTSDPLTLIPSLGLKESAWLSVCLMANDMATTGKAPMYAQFVLNLPAHFGATDFDVYWQHIHQFCSSMGTAITGGHTGRFEGMNATVSGGGTMIAIAPSGEMLTSKGAGEDDVIIVTKEPALIAASILSLSFPKTVMNACGAATQQLASELFYETSALETGLAAASLNSTTIKIVTAMHDVTEGGVLGAIYEMAMASGCGVWVEEMALPVGIVQEEVCKVFDIDPNYSIGAGSMVIAAKKGCENIVINALNVKGIKATVVGSFRAKEKGLLLSSNKGTKPLYHPGTDPYWKAFNTAYAKGLQ